MKDPFCTVLDRLAAQEPRAPGDYERDGLLYCGSCHTPKQCRVDMLGETKLFPVPCRCRQREEREEEDRRKQRAFTRHMEALQGQYRLSDDAWRGFTFQRDDRQDPAVSDACRRYVEHWEEMLSQDMGILFYGPVGTGKSFYAGAIVNALLQRRVPGLVTSFPRLLNLLQDTRERQACIDRLQAFHCLVLDDLGVERESSYASEQVYQVMDARSRSRLPLIVTTNLTLEELQSPAAMREARIYDRILDMCPIRIRMTGPSRRIQNAARRLALARELLLPGNRPPEGTGTPSARS